MADNNKVPVKRKAGNPYMTDNVIQLDDSISPVIATMRNWDGVDFHFPDQVKSRLDAYFNLCQAYSIRPGVAGMSMALGINRRRLHEIMQGTIDKPMYNGNKYKDLPKATRHIIQKAYDSLEVMWEYSMQSGKINPPCGIFLGKNHFGYQDVVDYNVSAKTEPETLPASQLQSRLDALPDDDA